MLAWVAAKTAVSMVSMTVLISAATVAPAVGPDAP